MVLAAGVALGVGWAAPARGESPAARGSDDRSIAEALVKQLEQDDMPTGRTGR